ncbi:response regulator transcription factor [Mesorhizobium muleiense]|uniref:response regulator transcription factor n=1 Tax=Mesorhizobium muleiense TaxID=1004279 RepID=UPI003AFAABAE
MGMENYWEALMSYASAFDEIMSSAAGYAASIATQQELIARNADPVAYVTPTVFVVDHNILVLQSLTSLIRGPGWQVETFASPEEFLCRPPVLCPHCLVIDVALPGLNGFELQKRVAADWTGMPIIFIRGGGEVLMTVQAMKPGAGDFATTAFGGDGLVSTIQHAIEQSALVLRLEGKIRALRRCYELLSNREREVMALVVTGLLNKQVGYELGISEITVKAHRGRMMQKMEAHSFADLIKMAAQLQLISWD